ncbi:hypothetical protein ACJMK2_010115 [Sinanodonta woodiana]|uniref:Chromosome transmission fidelity protein 8 homolog n=1 Tax=Sinanodonta woodiana TaxID=1069815 RepID=A0ABD3VFU6_SINWO
MVQIVIKVPREDNTLSEWAMIELQGSLETRHPVALNGRFIGDLHFTKKDVPVLIIGHHILYGKVVTLEKPFAVLVKDSEQRSENEPMETEDENVNKGTSYSVTAIIKKKLLFKTRPKPIIANVPKKL